MVIGTELVSSSEFNIVVANDKNNQIHLLLKEIEKTVNDCEELKTKNMRKIFHLIYDEKELDLLRDSVKMAFRKPAERKFYLEYNNARTDLKKRHTGYRKSFDRKWFNIKKDYREFQRAKKGDLENNIDVDLNEDDIIDDDLMNDDANDDDDDSVIETLTTAMDNKINIDKHSLRDRDRTRAVDHYSPEHFNNNNNNKRKRSNPSSIQANTKIIDPKNLDFDSILTYI
jgi:hypothetical protein